jgi:lysophospholipase L1-like esterase
MKKFLRRLVLAGFGVVFTLLLVELFLRMCIQSSHHDDFFHTVEENVASGFYSSDSTLFCVGDSTIFGIGASEPAYALPGVLQRFLSSEKRAVKVINLGYPGTNTAAHLELLAKLPEGSRILLRSGANNQWNQSGLFQWKVFGLVLQSRLLKLFFSQFPKLAPKEVDQQIAFSQRLHSLCKERKYTLLSLDYCIPILEFSKISLAGDENTVPVWRLFQKHELAGVDGQLDSRYRWDHLHPNDLGYYLEAILVWNEFCRRKWFSLTESQIKALALPREIQKTLAEDYEAVLKETLSSKFTYEMRGNLKKLQTKAELLYTLTRDEKWRKCAKDWEQIRLFVFHEMEVAIRKLDVLNPGQESRFENLKQGGKELIPYFLCYSLFFRPEDREQYEFYKKRLIENKLLENHVPPLGDFAEVGHAVPLELCAKGLSGSGISPDVFESGSAFFRLFNKSFKDVDFSEGERDCNSKLRGENE